MIRIWALLFCLGLGGCTLGYYAQSAGGQVSVLADRIPIEEMINNPQEHPRLVARLRDAMRMREFAIHELGLPDSGSFKTYVHLDRPFAVWNVVAAPEFSLRAKTWCYLVVGCLAYRGYFEESAATRYARKLRRQGYDVAINGVLAYSTLGWFDDPLFSTVISLPDSAMAELIFHELAHELVFVENDADFNEAFATTVGEEGVRFYLERHGTPESLAEYHASLTRQADFAALVARTRRKLTEVYAMAVDPQTMRAKKREIFAVLKREYRQLKTTWQGFDGFDWWFERELNNAHVVAIDTYRRLRPAFSALLAQSDFDLPKFYSKVQKLAELDKEKRDKELEKLLLTAAPVQNRPASRR